MTLTIGRRSDIPRQCFLKLLETASAEVREKLEAINPQAAREIRETVAEVAGTMQREVRDASRRHKVAARDARHLFRSHRLSEVNVHAAACAQQFAKTAAALSMLGPFPIDLVERVLIDKGSETVLILAKAAGCTWTTTKAILIMQAAGRRLSQQDLDEAYMRFERLSRQTAQRVVKFYERRNRLAAEKDSSSSTVRRRRGAAARAVAAFNSAIPRFKSWGSSQPLQVAAGRFSLNRNRATFPQVRARAVGLCSGKSRVSSAASVISAR